MTNNEKELLTLLVSHLNGTPAKEVSGVDFPNLFRLAEIHKVTPIIYASAKRNHRIYNTHDALAVLKDCAVREITLQVQRSSAFINIYKELRRGGTTPLVVKGITLRNIYPSPDMRISSDEDILIPIDQLNTVRRILSENGFHEDAGSKEATVHAFTGGGCALHIEVHTKLFPSYPKYSEKFNCFFETAFSDTVTHEIDGAEILSMNHTLHLLFLILHSLKHFIYCGFGIRQLADFAVYAKTHRSDIDTPAIVSALESVSALGFLGGMLSVCKNYLGLLPCELGFDDGLAGGGDHADLICDILSSGAYGNSSMQRLNSATITTSFANESKGILRSSLFPSYEALRGRYAFLDGHKALLPVAWIRRIISYALKKPSDTISGASESLEIGKKRLEMLKEYGILK